MSTAAAQPIGNADGVDLVALSHTIWHYRYLVSLAAVVGALIALVLALVAIPTYRAETVVSEVRDRGMASGLANQFSGLASLAGVNIAGAQGSEAQAVLKSRRLIEEFITRNNLLPQMFAGASFKPTLWRGVKRFKDGVLTIRDDKVSGLTTIYIDGNDPVVAARWANEFVALANELVRARALNTAKRNIAYLNEQLAKTNEVEIRRVMYDLIENETKTLMLANGRVEYAFTVIDPAVAPEVRIAPRRTLMVLLGFIAGGFLGVVVAFVHHGIVQRRRSARGA